MTGAAGESLQRGRSGLRTRDREHCWLLAARGVEELERRLRGSAPAE